MAKNGLAPGCADQAVPQRIWTWYWPRGQYESPCTLNCSKNALWLTGTISAPHQTVVRTLLYTMNTNTNPLPTPLPEFVVDCPVPRLYTLRFTATAYHSMTTLFHSIVAFTAADARTIFFQYPPMVMRRKDDDTEDPRFIGFGDPSIALSRYSSDMCGNAVWRVL